MCVADKCCILMIIHNNNNISCCAFNISFVFDVAACIHRKCKNGVFNKNICKCVCPKGYWGLNCERKYDTVAATAVATGVLQYSMRVLLIAILFSVV